MTIEANNLEIEEETSEKKTVSQDKPEITKLHGKEKVVPEASMVEKAIRESVYTSMGIGIVPLPFVNVAAVTASNLNMVRKLSDLHGVEFKESMAKKIIIAVTGASAGILASPIVESAVIGIPLIGLPLAVGTKPILNATTTYALGQMFVTHFDRGGSFVGANIESMKEDFAKAYKNSREWLGNVISGKKQTEAADV